MADLTDDIHTGEPQSNMSSHTSGPGAAHIDVLGRPRILMQQAGGTGGGGSGGSGGGEGGGDEDAIPTSKKALIEMIASTVNSAITGRSERDKKARAKEIGDAVAAALTAAGLGKKPDENEGGEGGSGGGEGGGSGGQGGSGGGGEGGGAKKGNTALEMEFYKLQKEFKKQQEATREAEERANKAARAAAANEEAAKLRSFLAGKVKEELLETAVELTGKRVVRDPETQEIMWKGEKWSEREGADNSEHYEGFDLGASRWLDGLGKHFAPAKQVGGGGTGRTGVDGKIKGGEVASDEDIGNLLSGTMFGKR